ncbi:DUF1624 domain-containing protein [Nocardioides sp. CFH 31398]|nr:DUF1624 domain-containing protein [Nocardioides sp. CFH 31398]
MALLGMVATHVAAERDPDGSISALHWLASGRASALFAVLAGVTLALGTGGRVPVVGRERAARSAGFAVRALLVALLGLALGGLPSGLAIILTYYGVLFLLGLPFVGLRAGPLLALAAVWCVVAPVLSEVVRPLLPERGFDSPDLLALAEPGRLVSELLFTGYYPAVPWLTYLLVGMAVGRMDLRRPAVAAALAVGGLVVAAAATAVSRLLVAGEVARRLAAELAIPVRPGDLDRALSFGLPGTTPTGGSWQWLLTAAPHSATPFDLAATVGSSLLMIGLCLLLCGSLPAGPGRAVEVLFGAGRSTLTLYSLHVVLRTPDVPPGDDPTDLVWHVLVLLAIGAVLAAARRRGPLEAAVGTVSTAVADAVRR